MSPRKLFTHLGILGGIGLAGAAAPSSAAADDQQAQVIIVHGEGEVRVSPDSLSVDVGSEARGTTLDQARDQVSRTMTAVTDALRALQIPDLTIQTEALSVNPIFGPRHGDAPPAIIGYAASLHASVTVRSVPVAELGDRGSRILDTALTAGANSVGGLDFFLANPSSAEQAALSTAVKAAQQDAETIALAAGVQLDGLYNLEETPGMHLVPRAAAPSALASTPVEVQDLLIQSSVTARYAFH
jgi:uncharacterized protein YggE